MKSQITDSMTLGGETEHLDEKITTNPAHREVIKVEGSHLRETAEHGFVMVRKGGLPSPRRIEASCNIPSPLNFLAWGKPYLSIQALIDQKDIRSPGFVAWKEPTSWLINHLQPWHGQVDHRVIMEEVNVSPRLIVDERFLSDTANHDTSLSIS